MTTAGDERLGADLAQFVANALTPEQQHTFWGVMLDGAARAGLPWGQLGEFTMAEREMTRDTVRRWLATPTAAPAAAVLRAGKN